MVRDIRKKSILYCTVMPSSTFKNMYVVLTYKHLNVPTDRVLDLVRSYLEGKYDRLLIVEEHGTDGQHDHLNVCVEWKNPQEKANIEKTITAAVYNKLQPGYEPKRYQKDGKWKRADLHIGHMTKDKDKFWYLGKEKDHKILVNDNWGEPPKPPMTIGDKINMMNAVLYHDYKHVEGFRKAYALLTVPYQVFPGLPSVEQQYANRFRRFHEDLFGRPSVKEMLAYLHNAIQDPVPSSSSDL